MTWDTTTQGMTDMAKNSVDITTNLVINQNDLLSVVISRAETFMHMKVKEANAEVKRLETALKNANNDLTEAVNEAGTAHFANAVTQFEAALGAVGGKQTVSVTASVGNKTIKAVLNVCNHDTNWSRNALSFDADIKLSASHKKIIAQIAGYSADLDAARLTVIDWRKKLSHLPTLERQYRAKLVEDQLNKTSDGKLLLESLDIDNFERQVLALPG